MSSNLEDDYLIVCGICRNEGGNVLSISVSNSKIIKKDCQCTRYHTVQYKSCKEHVDEYKFIDKKIDIVYIKCLVCDLEGFVGRRGELLIREKNLYAVKPKG